MTDRFQDDQPRDDAGREGMGESAVTASDLDVSLGRGISSRTEFELALPLYVGGDLGAAESTRVEAWLEQHPEDEEALDRAVAAHSVLRDHARSMHTRNTPDLWSGIRDELARSRVIGTGEGSASRALGTEHRAPAAASPAFTSEPARETPILGGPSWFQRKSVAAAAAFLLTGSIGFLLAAGGGVSPEKGPGVGESGLYTPAPIAALSAGPALGSGNGMSGTAAPASMPAVSPSAVSPSAVSPSAVATPIAANPRRGLRVTTPAYSARLVGGSNLSQPNYPVTSTSSTLVPSSVRVNRAVATAQPKPGRRTVPLQRAAPDAMHLIDEAQAIRLWQVEDWVPQAASGARLTGGNE